MLYFFPHRYFFMTPCSWLMNISSTVSVDVNLRCGFLKVSLCSPKINLFFQDYFFCLFCLFLDGEFLQTFNDPWSPFICKTEAVRKLRTLHSSGLVSWGWQPGDQLVIYKGDFYMPDGMFLAQGHSISLRRALLHTFPPWKAGSRHSNMTISSHRSSGSIKNQSLYLE